MGRTCVTMILESTEYNDKAVRRVSVCRLSPLRCVALLLSPVHSSFRLSAAVLLLLFPSLSLSLIPSALATTAHDPAHPSVLSAWLINQ